MQKTIIFSYEDDETEIQVFRHLTLMDDPRES
jgi:hypothetical protein